MKLKVDSLERKQIDNPQLIEKRERVQINEIRNEKGVIITDTAEIQRTTETTASKPMLLKWTTWKKWTKSWKGTISPNRTRKKENMNTIAIIKIESVIKKLPTNKVQNQRASQANSSKHLESTPILLKILKNCRGKNTSKFML